MLRRGSVGSVDHTASRHQVGAAMGWGRGNSAEGWKSAGFLAESHGPAEKETEAQRG